MLSEKIIFRDFKLPIEYLNDKKKLKEHLITDLELVKTLNPEENSMYSHLFNPKTDLGNMYIDKFKNYYTSNNKFLKDTQKFITNIESLDYDKTLLNKMYKSWSKIKQNEDFLDYYQYIDFSKLRFLNKISPFLFFLSIYNISSPVINIITPFAIMIIPFILIKLLRLPITLENYITILKREISKHPIGKIFTSFGKVSISQKVYMIVGACLYVYNLYQNILSCRRFYRNLSFIASEFNTIKNYLEYTSKNIDKLTKYTKNLKTYEKFTSDLEVTKEHLEKMRKDIEIVPTCKLNYKSFFKIGETMKHFYILYDSSNLEGMMNYTLGLNSYIELLVGLKENLNNKLLSKTTFLKDKKTVIDIKNIYNPSIKNPIKNDIDFSKNKIITGPNAAGKTTILKSTILNIIFSQQIGFGYFENAKLTPIDNIHCYINIPDSCSRDSLFQSEAKRCKEILDQIIKYPDEKHFCVFDELFSGTNPYEAICTAKSYLEYISKNKNVKFLLTTHFIRLCELCDKKNIENNNMHIKIENDKLVYTYKIKSGISKIKGGIHVLEDLGYNKEILENAKKTIEKF